MDVKSKASKRKDGSTALAPLLRKAGMAALPPVIGAAGILLYCVAIHPDARKDFKEHPIKTSAATLAVTAVVWEAVKFSRRD